MNELLEVAVALIKGSEGCELRAYPDPASPLYKALSKRGLLRSYMRGRIPIPKDLLDLSGAPWTIGYGDTIGVKPGDVWTQQEAEDRLRRRVAIFMLGVYKRCPQLHAEPAHRVAACVSLAYNIGVGAFAASSVCRHTLRRAYAAAADAFLSWRFAKGQEMPGLKVRRAHERAIYLGAVQ